jgi:LEA14-like dessication related protein
VPKDLAGLVVRLDGIRAVNQSDAGTEVVLTLRCHNETIRPIGVRALQVNVTLNGINLGRTVATKPIGVQAMSSNTLDQPILITDPAVAQQLLTGIARGSVTYQLVSRVDVSVADNELRSRSTTSGSVDTSRVRVR